MEVCPPTSQMKSRRRLVQGSGSSRTGTRVGALQPCVTVTAPNGLGIMGKTQGPRQCIPSSSLASHLEWKPSTPREARKRAEGVPCSANTLQAPMTGCASCGVSPSGPPPGRLPVSGRSASQASPAKMPRGPDAV